jgi:aspartate kinase
MNVLKFGGTSLGDAARMKNVAEIVSLSVSSEQSVLVVLSAISGSTNKLTHIFKSIKNNKLVLAEGIIKELANTYNLYIDQLFSTELSKHKAKTFIKAQLSDILEVVHQNVSPSFEYHLLAKGELISTNLFHLLLTEQNKKNSLLNALEFLRLDLDSSPDEIFLEKALNQTLTNKPLKGIFITQGFICLNAFGELSNLGRGGSDYSASLFASAINSKEIQIWTDIDGMHNNDPRMVENTQPIRELSFDEAAELAYFGAKILHPSSIKPAKRKNIPVRLLNTLEPTAKGTFISSTTTRGKIKAVAAKSGITAIKIRSSEMLQAPGFLRRIFEVFELYKTSIDMITTSEVAVSVTIDNNEHLADIVKTLKEFAHVEVDDDLSIISVVGEYLVESSDVALKVIQSLEGIPLRMISYGGSAHNISLLVSDELKVKALKALHGGLFNV